MATPASKKRSALKKSFHEDQSVVKKPRNIGATGIDGKIQRALLDHCSDWTDEMKYVRVCEGDTFVNHLRHQLEKKARGEDNTGALWWDRMQSLFGDPDEHSADALSLATCTENVEKLSCFNHLEEMFPPRFYREGMANCAKAQKKLTRAECVIATLAFKRCNPRGSADQYPTGMTLMRLFHRCSCNVHYPDVMACVAKRFDRFLEQTARFYSTTGVDPQEFIDENDDIVWLVLDETLVRPILALTEDADLMPHRASVNALCASSNIGRMLFSSAQKSIAQEGVREAVAASIRTLCALPAVTKAEYERAYGELVAKVAAMDGADLLGRVEMSVPFRGHEIKISCKTAEAQAAASLRVWLRNMAVRDGKLQPLPGENAFANDGSEAKVSVEAALVSKANRARLHLRKAIDEKLADGTAMTGDILKVCVKNHAKKMQGLDEDFDYDRTYLQWQLGEGGDSVKSVWEKNCLPKATGAFDVQATLKTSKDISDAASHYCLGEHRAELAAAHGMLVAMDEGSKLLVSTSVSSWLGKIATQLIEAVTWTVPAIQPAENAAAVAQRALRAGTVLRGETALKESWAHYKTVAPTALQDLHWFSVFRHRLTDDEHKQLISWRDALKTKAPAAPAAKATAKAPSKKQATKNAVDVRSAVRAALKLPAKPTT
mmetsp:Transcript_58957/g.108939  ORF Transcript_58957/g.108939 Transcript_58957/m.108939 type:complete len:661 (+) Transcript_58957:83-2065(+)